MLAALPLDAERLPLPDAYQPALQQALRLEQEVVTDAWGGGLAQLRVLSAQLASVRPRAARADAQRQAPLAAVRSVSAEQLAERPSESPDAQPVEQELP